MHSPLNLNLSLLLLSDSELLLFPPQLGILVVPLFSQFVCSFSSEPGSYAALYVEGGIFALLGPHLGGEVILVWLDNLIFPGVHIQPGFFALLAEAHVHLNSHFPHHNGRLCFVFISLNHPFILIRMVIGLLISLGESMVVSLTGPVVPVTTEVWLHLVSFFNFNSHTFYLKMERFHFKSSVTYLVVLHSDFDLEFVGHHELICFN